MAINRDVIDEVLTSKRGRFVALIFTGLLFVSVSHAEEIVPPGQLERVVVLSRHGVRSPTKTAQELGRWRRPDEPSWPDFRVQHPADLTLKGAELMQRMGLLPKAVGKPVKERMLAERSFLLGGSRRADAYDCAGARVRLGGSRLHPHDQRNV
jgi:hypothetical protein